MTSKERLFVYGSFCEGMVHFEMLSNFIQSVTSARVKGSVYRLQVGYLVFHEAGDHWVEGQVVELEAPAALYKLLDEFHGFWPLSPDKSLFHKRSIAAQSSNSPGETLMASVYAVNPLKLPKTATAIESGMWKQSIDQQPSLIEQLTERQSHYIKRLGASTGRDIVPIDLDLYRELMKMDLIVDKGRRLALTKLGKEVYRYLPKKMNL